MERNYNDYYKYFWQKIEWYLNIFLVILGLTYFIYFYASK